MMRTYRMLMMFAFTCWYHAVSAQQLGSVHIQSENNQLFYIQWNGEIINSSASGYLSIPKMPAGEQAIVIGFPKNQFPEYVFTCMITDRPAGFTLKLAVDNSWSLFDMVGFNTIRGRLVTAAEKALLKPVAEKKETGNLFGKALEDTSGVKNDTGIYKIFDQTTETGIDQIYVVNNDGKIDTVVVLISFLPENATGAANRKLPVPKTPWRENNGIMLSGKEVVVPVINKTALATLSSK